MKTDSWQQTILMSSDKQCCLVSDVDCFVKADVTERGAVLLGKNVACDGFEESRPLRVVTHAHADHLVGLGRSLRSSESVVMTAATKDLIEVLNGPNFLSKGNVRTVEYGEPLKFDGEQLTLHRVGHILGAAQALVEDSEGARVLYTGDFRIKDTPVLESDVMVIEATYGNPCRTRNFGDEARLELVSLVEQQLRQGPVYVFGYHGKLQEVMRILHEEGVKVPFVMPERVLRVSKVHQKHGVRIHRPLWSTCHQLQSTLLRDEKFVAFYHMSWRKKVGLDKFRICVSGWEFNFPCRQIGEKEYLVALSDHSDFKGLLEYVSRSSPKLVITDNYRAGDAAALAQHIKRQLGIEAKALPKQAPK